MKSPVLIIISLVFLVSFNYSCKVEKRVHRSGYHVEWYKGKGSQKQSTSESVNDLNLSASQLPVAKEKATLDIELPLPELSASAALDMEAIVLSGKSQAETSGKQANNTFLDEQTDCEVIVKTDGTRISAVVREITSTQIKYQHCDYPNGPMVILEASAVDRIIYANGMEDIISGYNSGNVRGGSANQQSDWKPRKLEVVGLLSFIFAIVGLFFAGIILGLAAFIMALISLSKFFQRPDEFMGKGFAIAGLIIGIVAIIGGILFALAVAAA